jgi:hypothetical protein
VAPEGKAHPAPKGQLSPSPGATPWDYPGTHPHEPHRGRLTVPVPVSGALGCLMGPLRGRALPPVCRALPGRGPWGLIGPLRGRSQPRRNAAKCDSPRQRLGDSGPPGIPALKGPDVPTPRQAMDGPTEGMVPVTGRARTYDWRYPFYPHGEIPRKDSREEPTPYRGGVLPQ